MNYRKLVRTVNTKDYYLMQVDPKVLYAQYNPQRFHLWQSLHKGPPKEALNMLYSPHYRFLLDRSDKSYFQLQKYYGRKNIWINEKMKKFLSVYDSIKNEGFKENVSAVEKPIVSNKFNKGFEIFEGHHRVACALALNIDVIPCEIIRRR